MIGEGIMLLIVKNDKEWAAFLEALDAPAKVKPGLKRLMEEDAPWD